MKKQVRNILNKLYEAFGEREMVSAFLRILDERTITTDEYDEEVEELEQLRKSVNIETEEDRSTAINNTLGLIPKSCLDMKIKDYYKGWENWIATNPESDWTFREFYMQGLIDHKLKLKPLAFQSDEEFTYNLELMDWLYMQE